MFLSHWDWNESTSNCVSPCDLAWGISLSANPPVHCASVIRHERFSCKWVCKPVLTLTVCHSPHLLLSSGAVGGAEQHSNKWCQSADAYTSHCQCFCMKWRQLCNCLVIGKERVSSVDLTRLPLEASRPESPSEWGYSVLCKSCYNSPSEGDNVRHHTEGTTFHST